MHQWAFFQRQVQEKSEKIEMEKFKQHLFECVTLSGLVNLQKNLGFGQPGALQF